jgi:putative tryptophan/tyrosine transport system substrate-binding protein
VRGEAPRHEAIVNRRELMNKRFVVSLLATLILASVYLAEARQPKVYRIGALYPGGPLSTTFDGLRGGLRELGFAEGKHFTLAILDTKGDAKAAEEAARNFEREKFDLIYALTTPMVTPARAATTNIPIVFCVGTDPVAMGVVDSFVKPGGRLTGVQYLVTDLTAKRLEILKEILPKLSRVIIFYNPGDLIAPDAAKLAREEAGRLGLKFIERHVSSIEELRKVLQALKPGEADAYFYVPDVMVIGQVQLIIDTAKAKKLATMFHERSLVTNGALASYGQNYYEIGRVSAKYVQRVLSGVQPRDLKVETIDDVELAINLQTAKQLGLTIPPNVLVRARKVIK